MQLSTLAFLESPAAAAEAAQLLHGADWGGRTLGVVPAHDVQGWVAAQCAQVRNASVSQWCRLAAIDDRGHLFGCLARREQRGQLSLPHHAPPSLTKSLDHAALHRCSSCLAAAAWPATAAAQQRRRHPPARLS